MAYAWGRYCTGELPTNYELAVNLKTAKTLGVTIPQAFLVRADRVFQ